MNKLEKALYSGDVGIVRNYISEMEFNYYTADDSQELKDSYEDFEFLVPNYDILLKALGMSDSQEPTMCDAYTDKSDSRFNKIDIYCTDFINLYFIRMEQYGLADEDATISRVIFTDNIENAMEECKEILNSRNIVLEAREFYRKNKENEQNER